MTKREIADRLKSIKYNPLGITPHGVSQLLEALEKDIELNLAAKTDKVYGCPEVTNLTLPQCAVKKFVKPEHRLYRLFVFDEHFKMWNVGGITEARSARAVANRAIHNPVPADSMQDCGLMTVCYHNGDTKLWKWGGNE